MKLLVFLIKKLRFLSAISIRLTGSVHPKHLISKNPWFLKYLEKNDKVLDLGCGNGQDSLKASAVGAKVIGVDKQMVSSPQNFDFQQADLEKPLDFKSNFFNRVLFLDVLEHLNNRDQIMKEVKRVLKPKGLLLLSIPNSETNWKRLQRKYGLNSFADSDHKKEYSLKEAKKVCSQAGFKILDIYPTVLDTPLAPIIDLIGGISLSLYEKLSSWKSRVVRDNFDQSTGFRIICQKL